MKSCVSIRAIRRPPLLLLLTVIVSAALAQPNFSGYGIPLPSDPHSFGKRTAILSESLNGTGGAQILICIDRSGSMNVTDPNRSIITIAKEFLDSVTIQSPESKVGIVIFGAGPINRNGAAGIGPLSLESSNLSILNAWIDSAGDHSGNTPYGAALDTALRFMNRLPPTDTNRSIIFLSDGEPCAQTNPCNDTLYSARVRDGIISLLPPVHAVYFHPYSPTQAARDTLMHLAAITGGTFTDANSANVLASVLLDTLLSSVLPPAAIAHASPRFRAVEFQDLTAYDILGRRLVKKLPNVHRQQVDFRVGSTPFLAIVTNKQKNKAWRTLLWK